MDIKNCLQISYLLTLVLVVPIQILRHYFRHLNGQFRVPFCRCRLIILPLLVVKRTITWRSEQIYVASSNNPNKKYGYHAVVHIRVRLNWIGRHGVVWCNRRRIRVIGLGYHIIDDMLHEYNHIFVLLMTMKEIKSYHHFTHIRQFSCHTQI
ncbi:hypothetical protein BC833DRAFT_640853 [Globomyces pollinis-pini]|nr:hypothetical protein BC833DRAFT_640853 [Globomyces pollinis-pini]